MNERRAEHEQLRTSMTRFATIMAATSQIDHAGLLRERMLFAQLLNAHLAREQEEVDQLAVAQPVAVATFRQRSDMIARLRADYSDHVRHWVPPLIRTDSQAYRSAVLTLQQRLTALMDWEEKNFPIYT